MTTELSADSPAEPYLRPATLNDLDKIADLACRAFIHDPVINYLGNVKKLLDLELDIDSKDRESRRTFFTFIHKACFLVGGRVTVIVDPASTYSKNFEGEKIIACALWLPPNKRLAAWMLPTIIRAGVIPVLKRWKLTGLRRIILDYQGPAEVGLHACFKKQGAKQTVSSSWYLQQIFTDPEYQGRGYMSQLVREAFAHEPGGTFTLEATTSKSRDQYTRLGFEVRGIELPSFRAELTRALKSFMYKHPTAISMGKRKSDKNGVKALGKDATGFEIWAMAKWSMPAT